MQFRNLKLHRIYNSRYVPIDKHVNISNVPYDSITTNLPEHSILRYLTPQRDIRADMPLRVHGDCPSVVDLPIFRAKDSWQSVDLKKQFYVFSAYIEGKTVRLIGAKTLIIPQLYCQLFYRLNQTDALMESVPVTARTIPEGHDHKYTATHFLCEFPGPRSPFAVSLVDARCRNPANIISIHTYNNNEKKRNFSVCATPLNFHYDRVYELIEWIELNCILGVEFFTLYNHTTGPSVDL